MRRYHVLVPVELWEAASAEADRRNKHESHLGRASVSSLVQQGLRLVLAQAPQKGATSSKAAGGRRKKSDSPETTVTKVRCLCGHYEHLRDCQTEECDIYVGEKSFPASHIEAAVKRKCFRCIEAEECK